MIRKHIIFHGRVQGVGFRYWSCMIATELGLTGWVKNLSDGTVEMEVQGSGMMISRLIHRLHNQRFVEITDMETTSMPVKENEFSFRPAN